MILKVIKAEAKASFLSLSIFRKIDQYITYDKQLIENIKSFTQKASMRDSKIKNFKSWNHDSKLATFQLFGAINKVCKKEKKDYQSHSQDS